MTRVQGFFGGLLLWSIPIAFWWKALSMIGPDDIITRHGDAISPTVSNGIGVAFLAIGAWACFHAIAGSNDFSKRERMGLCLLLLAWFGSSSSGAFAIASAQAELLALRG